MAEFVFKTPDVGEGVAEVEVVAWHVSPGDTVAEDQPLVDLMTDKATVEISSPVAGRLASIVGEPGEKVAVGSVLAVLEVGADAAAEAPARAASPAPAPPTPAPAAARWGARARRHRSCGPRTGRACPAGGPHKPRRPPGLARRPSSGA
ncbi:hypothetical protein LJR225_005286 [Phenylobacterium sp. LjRoot225]|uniref:biotin/lipoyl-containing protein n=1 Tax=Phenylobacterium sp. LjRoot225 TaxID=3342285 RepID=UPI003ECD734C